MRNTVRVVLAIFLGVLILANYNTIRILNLAVDVLNSDLSQRADLILNQVSAELTRHFTALKQDHRILEDFIRAWMKTYNIQGIAVYDTKEQKIAGVLTGLPADLNDPIQVLRNHPNGRWGKYLLQAGRFTDQKIESKFVLVFEVEKLMRIERSTRIVSYSNLLLMALAALVVFYLFESTFRPFRVLMQTARSAPAETKPGENRNEADFLIDTFNGVIAQLKNKEQELERLHMLEKARADDVQQLNQDLISSISSGLILIDHTGKINVFNQAAETILKRDRASILNTEYKTALQSISPAFKQDIDRCFTERINMNRTELEIHTGDTEIRYLGANIMPLQDRQQQFAGVICLFTDITEFKMLQKHMAEKEKYASLGEMAGGVAHEFRNSVATISGYVQLLENKIAQDQKSYTSPIQKELQSLQKVVNDFLSFARPVQLTIASVHLKELLHECIEEVRVASDSNIEFSMNGTFPVVPGDETRLRQVFSNLIRNAAESMDGTGRHGRVEISGSTAFNGKFSIVDVKDNGAGILADDISKIFTPFFSTKRKGVGLGLAIVQKLVLQHNGSISVQSSSDGSLFRVQLPVG
jgi:PAS domain S-box-containing protein